MPPTSRLDCCRMDVPVFQKTLLTVCSSIPRLWRANADELLSSTSCTSSQRTQSRRGWPHTAHVASPRRLLVGSTACCPPLACAHRRTQPLLPCGGIFEQSRGVHACAAPEFERFCGWRAWPSAFSLSTSSVPPLALHVKS